MGHPKFARRKYDTPQHPWKLARIEEEKALISNYGLKSRREIWKTKSSLRRWRHQAMKLIGRVDSSEGHWAREKKDLLAFMYRYGLLSEDATLDDVLMLTTEDLLNRRLQSQVYFKAKAVSMNQARQFINHGHIAIGEQKVDVAGYLVSRSEEEFIDYYGISPLIDEEHPLREVISGIGEGADYGHEDGEGERAEFTKEDVSDIKSGAKDAPSVDSTHTEGSE